MMIEIRVWDWGLRLGDRNLDLGLALEIEIGAWDQGFEMEIGNLYTNKQQQSSFSKFCLYRYIFEFYCQAQPQSQLQLGCSWFYSQLLRLAGKPTLLNSTFQAQYDFDSKSKVVNLNDETLKPPSDLNPICHGGHLTLFQP